MFKKIEDNLISLRQTKPLVLSLTNYVTVNFVANSLLSIGAAPIMSESVDEIEELVNISHVIYINIGTLNKEFIDRAKFACEVAKKKNKPIILDPVGAGASVIRTKTSIELLPFVDIVRGNSSEILALNDEDSKTMGVEATHKVSEAAEAAKALALKYNITVMISGAEDYITNGKEEEFVPFGSILMPLVTGMGCSLTSVVSAFRAVNQDSYQATINAASYFAIAGQIAEKESDKIGSFQVKFLDNLYQPQWNKIREIYEGR